MSFAPRAVRAIAAAVLLAGLAATPSSAEGQDLASCNGGPGISLDQQIAGCTGVINSDAGTTQENLAKVFNNRGIGYADKGQYDRAIEDYDLSLKLMPNDVGALNNRGNSYRKKGEYDRAIQDFDRAIELKPDIAKIFHNRGLAYAAKVQDDRAIQDYNEAIRLQPDFADAFVDRGSAYSFKGRYELAIRDFDQALKLRPNDVNVLKSRCVTRSWSGQQLETALADCSAALKLAPNRRDLMQSRSFVYHRMGRYDEAIADCNGALTGARSSDSLFVRGLAKLKMGDSASGRADIAAAEAIGGAGMRDFYANLGVTVPGDTP